MTNDPDIQDFSTGPSDQIEVGRVIEFAAGIPGFPALRRFRLEDLGPNLRPFIRLGSVEEPTIGFTVVSPAPLFPEYSVEIDEEHVAALGLDSSEDAEILLILTVPGSPQPPTANLLGPVVINRRTGAAAQVVQHHSSYGVAEPIVAPAA